jgi:acetolactate synthase-1/2/3 large subunit
MRVADYIFARLAGSGVDKVFGVTGRGSLYLSDAVQSNPKIDFTAMHHEQSAGYAAAAYAAAGKKVGVCLVSTGVGASNAISSVLSAWQDQLPVIFISGQNFSWASASILETTKRTFGEQEFDVMKTVSSITKFATVLEKPESIQAVMDEILRMALSGRPGPVWLDVPLDFQSALFVGESVESNEGQLLHEPHVARSTNFEAALELLSKSQRPVVLLGQGASDLSVRPALVEALSDSMTPIVYESSACDILPFDLEQVIGSAGALGGSRAGNEALAKSDLIIVIGSTYRSFIATELSNPDSLQNHIVFDFDELEIPPDMNDTPEKVTYLGPVAKETLAAIMEKAADVCREAWFDECIVIKAKDSKLEASEEPGVDLHDLALSMSTFSSEDAVFVTDSGLIEVIIPNHIRISSQQRLIHPHSQGAMGFALGASVGASLALSGRPVTVVIGDGSLMMNLQELQTIATLELAVRVIVVENSMYSIIRKRQTELFRGRTVGTDNSNGVECANLEKTAQLFGMKYQKAENLQQVQKALESAHTFELIEITGLKSQDYLKTGRAISKVGQLIEGTFEHMLPFRKL